MNTINRLNRTLSHATAVLTAGILAEFTRIKELADRAKVLDPSFIPPWETSERSLPTPVPLPIPITSDQVRTYKVRNVRDAVVNAVHELAAKAPGERFPVKNVFKMLQSQGFTYAHCTVAGAGVTIRLNGGVHRDASGRGVSVRYEDGQHFYSIA